MKIGCLLLIDPTKDLISSDTQKLKNLYEVDLIVSYHEIKNYISKGDVIYIASINITRSELMKFIKTVIEAEADIVHNDFKINSSINTVLTKDDFLKLLNILINIKINKSNRFGRTPLDENLITTIKHMYFFESKSASVIAEELNISRSSVYKYIS